MAARDYKPATPRKPPPPAPLGSWVSFVTGLGLGLVVALAVYFWNMRPSSAPPRAAPASAVVAPPQVEPQRVADAPAAEPAPATSGHAAPADFEPPRPKFDFYKILPEMEVPVQDWEKEDKQAEKSTKPDATADKENKETKDGKESATKPAAAAERVAYVVQIGSYKSFEEADQAKARLAMQGITATIQRVVINGQDVWFRVHVGPLADTNQVKAMRLKLQQSNTEFIVLKIGGSGTT